MERKTSVKGRERKRSAPKSNSKPAPVEEPIVWGSFPGSVVHGGLGHILRRRLCAARRESCRGCFLESGCPYTLLFEREVPPEDRRRRIYNRIPPGLRLTVSPWNGNIAFAGETVKVGITLFGGAVYTSELVLSALAEAFSGGIGRRRGSNGRGKAVAECFNLGADSFRWDALDSPSPPSLKARYWRDLPKLESGSFTLEFITPVRLQTMGRITGSPSFSLLLKSILRRADNIAHFLCGEDLDIDYPGLLKAAEQTRFEVDFRRAEVSRYSARQQRRMSLDGVVGKMAVRDCPEEILPWIALGAKLGVGKNSSWDGDV